MAQVTRRDITVPTTGVPTIPTPTVQPSAFAAALDVVGGFVQAKNQEVIRTKEVDFQTNSLSQFRTFADTLQGELKPNFGEDLNGYSTAYQEQLQRWVQNRIQDAPTPGSRNVAVSQLGQVMDSFNGRARKDEENAVVTAAKVHLEQANNASINFVFRNPDTIQEMIAEIEESVDSADWIKDKSQASAYKSAKIEEAWLQYARHFRENDPKELLSDVATGFYDDKLPPNIIAQLKDQADAEIIRNNRKGKAEGARALRAAKRDAVELIKVTEAGRDWDGDVDHLITALDQNPNREGADLIKKAVMEVIEDKPMMLKFASSPIPDQINTIRELSKGPTSARKLRLQGRMLRSFKETQNAVNNGLGMDLAVARGWINPPRDLDFNDPTTLTERIDSANMVREMLGVEVGPLFEGDKLKVKRVLDSNDLDAQVRMLDFLAEMPAGMQRRVANDLSKQSSEFAIAMDVTGGGEEGRAAARSILRGVTIGRTPEGRKFLPPVADMLKTFREELGQSLTLSVEHSNAVFRSVKAVYLESIWDSGNSTQVVDTDELKDAVKTVTGGMLEYDNKWYWPGGVSKIFPPVYGMTNEQFADRLEDPNIWLDLGDDISPDEIRDKGVFLNVSSSTYNILIGDQVVTDKAGEPFILDLTPEEFGTAPVGAEVRPGREFEVIP